ncbi:MAG: DNA mismatch repair endonuclease MutL [Firmicutes bacterium]|nr:DNA mismatch repair endonuclease MutL [Bacillota bacterium]
MGKIITLDEGTINKIAAGEVVERPASVVKELVENSIDAGASRINVEVKNGGVSFIKVIDNGSGIEEDDVIIAFERHSTSKIKHSDDLSSILSLGFRGEALASIAAVSKVEMVTRTLNKPYGIQIYVQGGNIEYIKQTGAPVGTSVIVKDLFFNTPARFKFLKKDTTEGGYVSDIISRIALSNPGISFKLVSNGATIIHTPGNNDLLSTIVSIYGTDIGKSVIEISYKDDLIRITGYAGGAEISRSNRNYQSLFVNGRYVKSKLVTSAIDEAYRTYLMKNRFAFIVLKIEIDPSAIDVNVHPAKMEVRFSDEQSIYRAVYHAVNNALSRGSKIIEVKTEKETFFKESSPGYVNQDIQAQPGQNLYKYSPDKQSPVVQNRVQKNEDIENESLRNLEAQNSISRDITGAHIIGQLFSTYVLLQKDDYLLIIDQHAAHERIIFEEMKSRFSSNKPMSQTLMVPVVINLTHQEIKTLDENKEFFNRLGFIYEEFGNNSIVIRAVPYGGCDGNEKEMFLELLDIVTSPVKENNNIITDRALYKIACKVAVKANMNLDNKETLEMLKKLSGLGNPYTCPHGRPTIIKISKDELEKMFKRRL